MIQNVQELEKRPEVSVLLNIIKLFNDDVYDHSISVASLVIEMLKRCDHFDEEKKDEIIIGAALHDVGKILVPFNLSASPRKFTGEEMSIMKTHTLIGMEMLKGDFSQTVCNIALFHHERPNGEGYVQSLNLSEIPEEALLVQVADIYDALISKRNYKSRYDKSIAISIMENEVENMMLDDEYFGYLQDILKSNENPEDF